MSALDDLLRVMDARCQVYHNFQLCGNWEVDEHELDQTCLHLVCYGDCVLHYQGEEVPLTRGDLVVFPKERPHRISSVRPTESPMARLPLSEPAQPEGTALLCASVHFAHPSAEDLLSNLPELTLIHHSEANRTWLEPLAQMILQESQADQPGQAAVLDHLAALIFMQVLRQTDAVGDASPGLLRLHQDPVMKGALAAFHAEPDKAWTLERLARQAAMSRSRFAQHFKAQSGWTPAQYLLWWRMQQAWTLLGRGVSVLETALQVGYQSEAAFSRSFKRHYGQSAGQVRRQSNGSSKGASRPVTT